MGLLGLTWNGRPQRAGRGRSGHGRAGQAGSSRAGPGWAPSEGERGDAVMPIPRPRLRTCHDDYGRTNQRSWKQNLAK